MQECILHGLPGASLRTRGSCCDHVRSSFGWLSWQRMDCRLEQQADWNLATAAGKCCRRSLSCSCKPHPIQSLLNPAQLPSGVHHALWQGASLSFPVPRFHACSCFTLSVAAAEVSRHQPFTACWSPLCVPTTSVPSEAHAMSYERHGNAVS